jgi:hypothetical protein
MAVAAGDVMATRWRVMMAAAGISLMGTGTLSAIRAPQQACAARQAGSAVDAGCPSAPARRSVNRVRGVLRGPTGRPLPSTKVDLVPIDVEPDPNTGHVRGTASVTTNERGEFEFSARASGRYHLGVSLYNAPSRYGPSYPRTYYPGTVSREAAIVIDEQVTESTRFDFMIPSTLAKGELEVIVDADGPGRLEVCFEQLENTFSGWSSTPIAGGAAFRTPVVDGQRYQVHVHVRHGGSHLESQPQIFTATATRTVLTLRPDAPRLLHP